MFWGFICTKNQWSIIYLSFINNGTPKKHDVALEMVQGLGTLGSRDPNGLYGTQEAFGQASFPQNPLKK